MNARWDSGQCWRLTLGGLALTVLVGVSGCGSGSGSVEQSPTRTAATPIMLYLGTHEENINSALTIPSPVVLVIRNPASPEPSPDRLKLTAAP